MHVLGTAIVVNMCLSVDLDPSQAYTWTVLYLDLDVQYFGSSQAPLSSHVCSCPWKAVTILGTEAQSLHGKNFFQSCPRAAFCTVRTRRGYCSALNTNQTGQECLQKAGRALEMLVMSANGGGTLQKLEFYCACEQGEVVSIESWDGPILGTPGRASGFGIGILSLWDFSSGSRRRPLRSLPIGTVHSGSGHW